jgi:hypothetical protein
MRFFWLAAAGRATAVNTERRDITKFDDLKSQESTQAKQI